MADSTACEVYTGVWPQMWWPWNISDLKQQIAADLLATNIAATTCKALDAVTLAEWSVFYAAAFDWTQSSTIWFGVGGQADQAQRWQCALYTWKQELKAAQCGVVDASNPNPPHDSVGAALQNTGQAARWIGIAAASIAGAYVVGQIAHLTLETLKLIPEKPARKT